MQSPGGREVKSREARMAVMLPARLRIAGAWTDVRIRNVSSRGMLLEIADPPLPGCYVEVARGRYRYTARVAWAEGNLCGIHIDGKIQIAALTESASPRLVSAVPVPKSAGISAGREARIFRIARRARLILVRLGQTAAGAV